MIIGVPKETARHEARIAITPDTIKRLVAKKIEVLVEAGAGATAGASDDELQTAGAKIVTTDEVWSRPDVVVKVQPPSDAEIARARDKSALISLLYPLGQGRATAEALAKRGVTTLAADLIPRTTLAQMMDVLSSQATIAGYRAVLLAAAAMPKMFPMMMTAAGTIPAAKVLILGAGVAGLQAIATARRLGAVVEATDVRKVVKEQVQSLGAKFLEVASEEDAQTASGYAKELSEDYKKKQEAMVSQALARCDAAITTALIPGRPAPRLISEEQVKGMKRGAVIVDLAAEQGGNCALTKPGERITVHGVTIVGEVNLPSQVAVHASAMYSRNMEKLLLHLAKDGNLTLDTEKDEIARGMLVARGGEIVHPQMKGAQ